MKWSKNESLNNTFLFTFSLNIRIPEKKEWQFVFVFKA